MKNFAFYAKAQPSTGIAKIVFNYLLSRYPNERFGDVCETTSGGTPNRGNADFYNGNIPWLKSGELNDGLITSYEETITDLGLKNSSAKIFPKDTLLVAMYGATAGKIGLLNFDAATNQAVCAIFPGERIQRDFVFWYLKQQRVDFIEISRGGAQPNISQTVIKNAVIPCPSIEVQETVVAFLDKVDAGSTYQIPNSLQAISREVDNLLLIRNRFEAANSELKSQTDYLTQLRQALLREAMQGQLLPQDPTDEPAALLLKKLQAAKAATGKGGKAQAGALFAQEAQVVEGPFEIPSSWVWCKLGDICEQITDGEHQTPPRIDSGRLLLSAKNVRDGYIDYGNVDYISEEHFQKAINRCRPQIGSILIVSVGATIGRSAILKEEKEFALVRSVALINPRLREQSAFLKFVFDSPLLQKSIAEKSWGTAQPCLYLNEIKDLTVPLPPLAEQHRIVAKLEQLMQHCDALEQRIRESRQLAEQLLATALREALAPPDGTALAAAPEAPTTAELAAPRRRGRPPRQPATEVKLNDLFSQSY